ncbi:MAG TPA: nucleotide exchange factor GrpE [Acidimicrobiales bacterium]|nr:nucleotide exchange factor GrpE [Acidimicrobiales bacterium]
MSGENPGSESETGTAEGGQPDPDPAPGVPSELSPEEAVAAEAIAEEGGAPVLDPVVLERNEYRESLQRLQADFENYRKRVTKQTEEIRERAAESLVEKLLPVLDTCELALSHGAGEDVKQLSASLFAVLEKEGLEKIDNVGEPFDPNCHDAVAHEPGDGGGQEVAEVMRAGYRWRGRVIRPAMVKVRG